MNFLAAVNRVLRAEAIIRGDTDAITTFSDLQHGATVQLAMIAIQDELNELVSDQLFPYEKKTTGSITTVADTRTYALATDFVRFYGNPMLYCSADNFEMSEYPGGQNALRMSVPDYKTTQGNPYSWYFEEGTTKQIGFFQVPNAAKTYTYDYEYEVAVTNATDTLPFHNESEAQAFCRLAARRFKYLFREDDVSKLIQDPEHQKGKATLSAMVKGINPPMAYGNRLK